MNSTKFGRFHTPEKYSALLRLHHHREGGALTAVDHEPKNAVLDQEDLLAQGIKCSVIVAGATDVDALGSCTAQATTSALSNVLAQQVYFEKTGVTSYQDTKGLEIWAIKFYHTCTDQTGNSTQEWPPTDCGSSGPYIVEELTKMGLISADKIAIGANNLVSLMQTDGVLMGSPWFNAWETPNANGFLDGNGTTADIEKAIQSGVAGGHETYLCAVESVSLTANGQLDPNKTILRGRNSWTKSWGDVGDYRIHLSTLMAIASYCDFRQLVA